MKHKIASLLSIIILCFLFSSSCSSSFATPFISTPTLTITLSPTTTNTPTITPTSTPIRLQTDLPIVTDLSDPEKIPYLSWDYINSPDFIKTIISMDDRGLLEEMPETVKPVDHIVYRYDETTLMIKNNGFDTLFMPDWPGPYSFINQRPWVLIGIWKTTFDNIEIFVYIDKWKNKDGTFGFLGYIVDNGLNMINLSDLQKYSKDTTKILLGRYFVKNETKKQYDCDDYSKRIGFSTFCEWYFDHPEIVLAPDIFNNWQETGILTNMMSANEERVYFLPLMPPVGYRVIR